MLLQVCRGVISHLVTNYGAIQLEEHTWISLEGTLFFNHSTCWGIWYMIHWAKLLDLFMMLQIGDIQMFSYGFMQNSSTNLNLEKAYSQSEFLMTPYSKWEVRLDDMNVYIFLNNKNFTFLCLIFNFYTSGYNTTHRQKRLQNFHVFSLFGHFTFSSFSLAAGCKRACISFSFDLWSLRSAISALSSCFRMINLSFWWLSIA